MDNSVSLESKYLEGPVSKTVLKNIIPAMLLTLMMLIYNLADTFFIGLTHNDYMVAAVSLATPVFLIFMAIGTLFGVGGASVISRSPGVGNKDYASRTASFCTWTSTGVGIVMMICLWSFMDPLLEVLGASAETMDYTRTYLSIVTFAGIFSVLSGTLSNIIRAGGNPTDAMWGTLIGNIANVVLDPVMIFGFHMGIAGAAVATVIGNGLAAVICLFMIHKKNFILSIRLKDFSAGNHICSGVLAIGVPAALTSLLTSFAQIFANSLIAAYGDMAVAAYGIAAKIRMCFSVMANGMGHGLQPVFGYCYGAKEKERFKDTLRFSILFALIFFSFFAVLCMIFASPIVNVFLTDQSALDYGVKFIRLILISGFFMGVFCILMSMLQTIGAVRSSLFAALSREGIVYVPMVFILKAIYGLTGIVTAQPFAELISMVIVMFSVRHALHIMSSKDSSPESR